MFMDVAIPYQGCITSALASGIDSDRPGRQEKRISRNVWGPQTVVTYGKSMETRIFWEPNQNHVNPGLTP